MKPNQDTLSISRFDMHRRKLEEKHNQFEGLKALYAEWIQVRPYHDSYMKHLRQRIDIAEKQLKAMRP